MLYRETSFNCTVSFIYEVYILCSIIFKKKKIASRNDKFWISLALLHSTTIKAYMTKLSTVPDTKPKPHGIMKK